jgi:predicted DNA-binding protein
MEVRISAEAEARLIELSGKTGRAPGEIVEDALAGYSAEVDATRTLLARRLREVRSGEVQPLAGCGKTDGTARSPCLG